MKGEKPNMGRGDGKGKQDVQKLKNIKRRGWNQREGLIKCGTNLHK